MKLVIELELTEEDARAIRQNSIERVLNNGVTVAMNANVDDEYLEERRYVFLEDVEALKPVVNKLWFAARDAIFKAQIEAAKK